MLPLDQLNDFTARVEHLLMQKRRWAGKNKISCFRLYDQDVPGFPFQLDVYEDRLLWWSLDEEIQEPVVEALCGTLGWKRDHVHLKVRQKQSEGRQYEKYDEKEDFLTVHEGGLKFLINPSDYLDTGLFLDHRWTRSYVRDASAGLRVLNLFCYTGSFTVYAAQGGAFETTSVDLNQNYLSWAEKNLQLNGFSGKNHHFLRRDVLEFLRSETRKTYDLIVLDPPTFSNSKKMDGTLDIQRDHTWLIQNCLKILAPDGILFFSNNYKKFQLATSVLKEFQVQEITHFTLPKDFHKGAHKSWLITHVSGPKPKLLNLDLGGL